MADTKLFSSQMSNPLPGNARLTLKKSDGSEIGSYEPLGEDKEITLPTGGSDNVFFATYGTTTLREVQDAIAADKLVIARDLNNNQYTIAEATEVRVVFESVQRRPQSTAPITYERLVLVDSPIIGGGWSSESQVLAKKSDLIVHHDATLDGDGTEANPLTVVDDAKDAFYFGNDVEGEVFGDALSKGKFLVYQTIVTSGSPRPTSTTRNFVLVNREQRAGDSSVSFLFACVDGETIYKVSISYDMVAETLTFGDVTELTVPTNTSDLTNDSGFITEATFVATYNTTAFADIQEAIADGKCVKCDVSGYTYELVHALSNKITFALTNNVDGNISQETVWVNSDNTWDGEGVNLAKVSSVPTKTSELENDSGFIKPPEGEGESGTGFVMTSIGWTETFVALYGIITTDMSGADILSVITTRQLVMLYDMLDEDHVEKYNFTGYALDLTTHDFILNFVGSPGTATARISFRDDSIRWEFKSSVKSTDITSIVKVSAMPENPDPNTLYLVVEEEPTTASEAE